MHRRIRATCGRAASVMYGVVHSRASSVPSGDDNVQVYRLWRYARRLAACCPQRKVYRYVIIMCISIEFGDALAAPVFSTILLKENKR